MNENPKEPNAATVTLNIPAEYWKQENWSPVNELRWAYGSDDNEPVLQRAWLSNLGNIRWEDVPSVRLPPPKPTLTE